MKKLIVFDLDGTLAVSKSALDGEMAELLGKLLTVAHVAVISGGDWPQFEIQVVARLANGDQLQNLSILPTTGTKFYRYTSEWQQVYAENFTEEERKEILDSLQAAVKESDLKIDKTWGDQIEDRGSQITFSALGQKAPIEAKEKWDPDFQKRKNIQEILSKSIPEFSVKLGGTTSVDITKPGIDKGYGIHKLQEILNISIDEMLFIGDAVFPGGNDYAAKQAGVYSICVRDPEETKRVVEAIVACLQ